MAARTSKFTVCVDTYREGEESKPLRGARVINVDTLKEMGEAPVGAWESEKAVVLKAIEDFYERGGFRSGGMR